MSYKSDYLDQYDYAHKKARKDYLISRIKRKNPYLVALDDIVDEHECTIKNLGEIDVPSELIVGTKTVGRRSSFSHNFMPLLSNKSEFAHKWMKVCEYHLSDSGIGEAPKAYEYLGRFYIEEGNKRVSVLKSYGAPFITLDVKRLVPKQSERKSIKLYYEFLDFYNVSKLYSLQFSKLGYYNKFLKYIGFEKDHDWTRNERIRLVGFYGRLCNELSKRDIKENQADCVVALLEMYTYDFLTQMSDKQLEKIINENKTRLRYGKGFYNIECIADEEDSQLYSDRAPSILKDTDFIISAGDLSPRYLEYLVTVSNKPLLYIHGNHDDEMLRNPPEGCICIDDDLYIFQGIRILGLGGSFRYSNGNFQYTEVQMERRIKKLKRKIRKAGGVDIVVSHAPIAGYGDLPDYAHQGFECFNKLLEELKPHYWFYGHVHLNYGQAMNRLHSYKKTMIVNVYDRYSVKY